MTVNTIFEIILGFVSILIFLFSFWKKLKEDYSSTIIFSSGFTIIFAILITVVISKLFFQNLWFWLAMLGVGAATIWSNYKLRLNFFETIDASVFGLLPWLFLTFLFHSVIFKNDKSLGAFFVVVSVYLMYYFLSAHYKKFVWYPSGKVGFSGLASLGILFLLRAVASLFIIDMLSFVGSQEAILSGIVSFLAFLGVFHLARKIE